MLLDDMITRPDTDDRNIARIVREWEYGTAMKVGIVIPVRNCLNYTVAAVDSIKTQHNYKVIVVDDHSDASTKGWLSRNPQILSIIDPSNSTGVAHLWNIGIKKALDAFCTHVLVMNNDILLHPFAIDNLVNRLDRGDVVLVTGFNIGEYGKRPEDLYSFLPNASENEDPDFCCFIINENTVSTIGYFDERYLGAYCEDQDYRMNILSKGKKAVKTGLAPVYHHKSRTTAENPDIRRHIDDSHQKNRAYLISKWGTDAEKQPVQFTPFAVNRDVDPVPTPTKHVGWSWIVGGSQTILEAQQKRKPGAASVARRIRR
jgi:GT2 family glycosyltransferase